MVVVGAGPVAESLRALGLGDGPERRGYVYDGSDHIPAGWDDLADTLNEAFDVTQLAVRTGVPLVYVVHEPSVWGHEPPLRSALATALLGGVRSVAVEVARRGGTANAVTVSDGADVETVARAVAFLMDAGLNGQVITCGSTHLGRPAA